MRKFIIDMRTVLINLKLTIVFDILDILDESIEQNMVGELMNLSILQILNGKIVF